nr:acyl-CoA thioesterase II [Cryptococcus depauperatus CBS 7841]
MSLTKQIGVFLHPSKPATFIPHDSWMPTGARGLYGGLIVSQSLLSSLGTVPEGFTLQSAHCYFLNRATLEGGIEYEVEDLAVGRTFIRKLVKGKQNGKLFFIIMTSYELRRKQHEPPSNFPIDSDRDRTRVSNSLTAASQPWDEDSSGANGRYSQVKTRFQVPFPQNLLPWDKCEDNNVFLRKLLQEKTKEELGWKWRWFSTWSSTDGMPSSTAVARKVTGVSSSPQYYLDGLPTTRMVWHHPRIETEEVLNEETYKAMLAYVTDFQFVGTAARSVGLNASSEPQLGMIASLDHTIHFYPFPQGLDYRKPVLHVMESQVADTKSERAVCRGRVYSSDGHLLAVTSQEGLFRARRVGETKNGCIESGLDEEDLLAKL